MVALFFVRGSGSGEGTPCDRFITFLFYKSGRYTRDGGDFQVRIKIILEKIKKIF